jgi:hypothetical protein
MNEPFVWIVVQITEFRTFVFYILYQYWLVGGVVYPDILISVVVMVWGMKVMA